MRIMVLAVAAAALMNPTMTISAQAQIVLHSPGEISACLCQQQSVAALNNQVAQSRQAYDQSRKALETLEAEVSAQRSKIDVYDFDQVRAFAQLLDRRDKAAANLEGQVMPSYADVVARYDGAVTRFNASCGGKAYDAIVLAQVRSGLSCPAGAR